MGVAAMPALPLVEMVAEPTMVTLGDRVKVALPDGATLRLQVPARSARGALGPPLGPGVAPDGRGMSGWTMTSSWYTLPCGDMGCRGTRPQDNPLPSSRMGESTRVPHSGPGEGGFSQSTICPKSGTSLRGRGVLKRKEKRRS